MQTLGSVGVETDDPTANYEMVILLVCKHGRSTELVSHETLTTDAGTCAVLKAWGQVVEKLPAHLAESLKRQR